jgi:carbon monoxide dehydrogenase subunit G
MQIESKQFTVASSSDHVLSFLAVPENLEKLLPAERIQEFSADEKQCSFKAQGGIIISLVFNERTSSSVSYRSGTNSPFPFSLLISVEENDQKCTGQLSFKGEASPFIAMMAKGPLTALFNDMGENLVKVFK